MTELPLTVSLPLALASGNALLRLHPMARHRKMRAHRVAAHLALKGVRPPSADMLLVCTITRVYAGRQRPYDGQDNLRLALKAVVDGVAEALGVDDGSPRWRWEYRQERGERPCVLVRLEAGL